MNTFVSRLVRTISVSLFVLLGSAGAQAQPALMVYDFTLDGTPAQNVDLVASLGYSGLVTRVKDPADLTKLADYAAHVATLDDFQMLAYVVHDFSKPNSVGLWHDVLPILASIHAPLWVIVKKAPSAQAIRDLLEEMATGSQAAGVRTVVYPHWNTSIETAAEASSFIAQVRHPNLRNSIHTCHEIRGGHQYEMESVAADYADETALVAIAGADEHAYAGPPQLLVDWDDVIKPLDEGDYSLAPFLHALHDSGYDGPVILQTFGLTGDPDHLQHSLRKYAAYTQHVALTHGGTRSTSSP